MGHCQECRADIAEGELCTDCLEQLGIQRDTADRLGLTPGLESLRSEDASEELPPPAE